MRTYKVEITEVYKHTVEVEAESGHEAINEVWDRYDVGLIKVDKSDFYDYSFKEVRA